MYAWEETKQLGFSQPICSNLLQFIGKNRMLNNLHIEILKAIIVFSFKANDHLPISMAFFINVTLHDKWLNAHVKKVNLMQLNDHMVP